MRKKTEAARDPETPTEWQDAVDSARFYLAVDSCVQYGLMTGPKVNVDRCVELLERGKALGYRPAPIDDLVRKFLR